MSDTTQAGPMAGPVDWEFAKAAGARIVPAGPRVTADEAAGVVASVHAAAARALQPVADTARLHAPGTAPLPLVVDRPTWIGLNADSMAAMVGPVFEQIVSRRKQQPSPGVAAVGGKVTGGEAGALLAFMASRVLGQYDLAPGGTPRLLLVAPNLVHVERELGVDPEDFRLWVCMHEETHRVQFTAVPWLRDHMIERARSLAGEMAPDPEKLQDTISRIARQLPDALKSGGAGDHRAHRDARTAREAGPDDRASCRCSRATPTWSWTRSVRQIIPSVAGIRAKFNQRRQGVGCLRPDAAPPAGPRGEDAPVPRRRTCSSGPSSTRSGWTGSTASGTRPRPFPLPREIEEPSAWVARVHRVTPA